MTTENLSTLKIHKLSQEQFEREREAGRLDSSALYLTPDENSSTIIDVTKLPTENINESALYRLVTGQYVYSKTTWDNFVVHCVESLPEAGLPATNADISMGNIYYSVADNKAYGYIDDMLSVGLGVPAGWYDDATLLGALSYNAGGVITDINDAEFDSYCYILINYDFYVYKNGWIKLIYAEEKPPKFDLTWNGEIGDRFVLDMSMLGYDAGTYFVKVSDKVLSVDDIIGGTYEYIWVEDSSSSKSIIYEEDIDTSSFPGAFTINDWIVIVQDEDTLATALEVPSGFITNGVYYLLVENVNRTVRLTTSKRVTKIDGKYLDISHINPDNTNLHPVAFSGSWNHLDNKPTFHSVATTGDYNSLKNKPTIYTDAVRYDTTQSLSSTAKSRVRTNIDVYSKSEVEALIDTAIGSAIGGSY